MTPSGDEALVTVIRPQRGWRLIDLRELWFFRELQYFLVWRDVKVRYKQTSLGIGWALLQPLLTMITFSVLFGGLAGLGQRTDGIPYPLFVFSGLLLWTFFSSTVTAATTSMISNQQLISKVYFPRIMIPWGTIGAGLVDLAISFLLFVGMLIWYGVVPGLSLLLLPVLIFILTLTAAGVGTTLAALAATYRDFRYLVTFFIQLWLYATPVIYPLSLVPEKWRWLLCLNPLTGILEAFRFMVFGIMPEQFLLLTCLSTAASLVMFLVSLHWFQRLERTFADII